MKEKSYSLTFDCVWIAANLLLCSVAFSQSLTHVDVKYGPHERNVLDFYQAKSDTPTPVIVYIHGGGFYKGGKHLLHQWYADVLEKCLAKGVSVAAINYRFINTASLPEIFRDVARAVQFIRHNAKEWNVDKTRFGGFGSSAGAGTLL